MTDNRARTFIEANTRMLRPPLVPEVTLHLAEESLPIWRKSEEELGEMNVPPPYWAFVWAGGQALARYILDTPETVTGKTVLDIGSGSGLVAIAAALAGAKRVIANDIDAFAIAACRLNAAANQAAVDIVAVDLLACGSGAPIVPSCDVALLGDLFYEKELAARALTFAAGARRDGSRVLVGDPRRSFFPVDRFTRCASYAVPVTRELEDSEIKKTTVWEFED
ncbi:MAG: class I SAM-dependent methyltransferase [Hyphomicrobiaceae bacterium]